MLRMNGPVAVCGVILLTQIVAGPVEGQTPDRTFLLDPLPYGALYYPGEEVRTGFALADPKAEDGRPGVCVRCVRVVDWQDRVVYELPISGRKGDIVLSDESLKNRFGAFQALVMGRDAAGKDCELARLRFARLTSKGVAPCRWVGTGTHPTHGWGWGELGFVDLIAAAGIGIVRDEPAWHACELTKGAYAVPPKFEAYVDRLLSRGIRMNMALGYGNKIYENPLDPEAFARFCGWIAKRYAGRVDRFEIWNEPHNFQVRSQYHQKGQSELVWVRKFIDLTQKADDAIRAVRPDAVVAVAAEDWDRYLDMMLTNGIARAHNAVSFHPYCHRQHRPEREMFLCDFGARQRTYAKACGGADRWCVTEAGWTTFTGKGEFWEVAGFYPRASLSGQAACIVRMYLSALEAGCDYACQYDFRDDGTNPANAEHNFGLVHVDGSPKPSFAAVAFMTRLLGPAEFIKDCSPAPTKYRMASFRRNGVPIYALWAIEGEVEIDLPEDVLGGCRFDLMGNRTSLGAVRRQTLTETPVYLQASSREAGLYRTGGLEQTAQEGAR